MKILIKVIFLCCMSGLIGISHAQHTVGENAILYVGSRDEDGTQPVYILDIEHLAEHIQIGTVNQHGSETGWSPDGRYVFIINYDENDNRILTLYDVNADTSQVMTDRLYDNECYAPVFWSPDGRYLAYQHIRGEQVQMSLWDSINNEGYVIENVREEPLYYDAWSPDGRYLALPDARSPYQSGVFIWDTVIQDIVMTIHTDTYLNQEFRWSPDSNYIVFADHDNGSTVSILNFADGTHTVVSGRVLGTVSPDGRYVVYFQRGASYDEPTTMYIYDIEEQQQILVSEIASVFATTWSPDSQTLSFKTWHEEYQQGLSLYDVVTGETTQILPPSPLVRYAFWSATSQYLAVVYSDDGRKEEAGELAIYNRATGELQYVDYTIPNVYYAYPIHSAPVGDYLMMMTVESGDVLFDAAANHAVDFSIWTERNPYIIPAWSADGQYIVFGGYDGSNSRIYIYDFATNEATALPIDSDWSSFIGWRGTNQNVSLIHCGEG